MDAAQPDRIETVFLDAGNTLISMDYSWIGRELAAYGFTVAWADLERAEAAARPATSEHVAGLSGQSGLDAYHYYLCRILERLPAMRGQDRPQLERLGHELAQTLKSPGGDHRLWSIEMPGVSDALARLSGAGLKLVVVSNSDGSVERALELLGLTVWIDAVLDSHIVGFEKPDPRFFGHALGIAGARADTTLHVGDMYYQDILGARAAGIWGVLLDPHDDWGDIDCIRRRNLVEVTNELLESGTLGD